MIAHSGGECKCFFTKNEKISFAGVGLVIGRQKKEDSRARGGDGKPGLLRKEGSVIRPPRRLGWLCIRGWRCISGDGFHGDFGRRFGGSLHRGEIFKEIISDNISANGGMPQPIEPLIL